MQRINMIGALGVWGMIMVGVWYHRFDIIALIIIASVLGAMVENNE